MVTLTHFPYASSLDLARDDRRPALGARTGRLLRVDGEGRPMVDFVGNPGGPVAARMAVGQMDLATLIDAAVGSEVLLVFEDDDIARPVIVGGPLLDRLPVEGVEIFVRGRRLTLEADQDVELRCGDAKLQITRDGKVVVLGNDVVSRARRRQRIKGGTVNIN